MRSARTIAIANQKGGVGKTTTAVNLSAALAERGRRVLLADLDPQGNASTGLGIAPGAGVYEVLLGEVPVREAIVPTAVSGLFAVPADLDLVGAEIGLAGVPEKETRLKEALGEVSEEYDFVLLDCGPSLGIVTVNALAAAQELIVPVQCEYYGLEALGRLLQNVRLIQRALNPGLRLVGILLTMHDPRTILADEVVAEVRRHFGGLAYDVVIPRSVRVAEAPSFAQPITTYDPNSRAAHAFRALAREVEARSGEHRDGGGAQAAADEDAALEGAMQKEGGRP